MTKLSFNERSKLGELFLKYYLLSIGWTDQKISFSDLENCYNNSFKDELIRGQKYANPLPNFSSVLNPLSVRNIIFRNNSGMVSITRLGSKVFFPNQNNDAENPPVSLGSLPNRRRKRSRNTPAKLAVDQHIVMNKESQDDSSNAADSGEPLPRFITRLKGKYKCIACGISVPNYEEIINHTRSKQYQVALKMDGLKNDRDLVKDKNGVVITSDFDGESGLINIDMNETEEKIFDITIKNTNKSCTVKLFQCEKLIGIRAFRLDDVRKITERTDRHVVINPGQTYAIHVRVESKSIGFLSTPLAFSFQVNDGVYSKDFHVVRYLQANCLNDTIRDMRPKTQFQRAPRKALKKKADETIEGFKLPSPSGDHLGKELRLGQYQIPSSLRRIINRGLSDTKGLNQAEKVEQTNIRLNLEGELTIDKYCKRLEVLLSSEEIQMEVDMRQYDMEDAVLYPSPENNRLLVLEVPGLAENRPSILRGDCLLVREANNYKKEYRGYVHAVHLNTVSLGFDLSLVDIVRPDSRFHVQFTLNRLGIRLQHLVRQLVDKERALYNRLLFPDTYNHRASASTQQLKFYSKIKMNPEQESAIRHILAGTSKPAPYLIFGPPGTGKTFTIVEAMKQILTHMPNAHILACAPSNAAADWMTEKLLDDEKILGSIMRLNAVSQNWKSVAEKVKHVCNYDRLSQSYYYPSKKDLMQYRVIVCTAVTAGRLVTGGIPRGHFTHVFFDEAGHSLETETLIPVTNILDLEKGQLVLAGDPKQLGPILRSPLAIKYGFGMSLLERYMTTKDIYQRQRDQHGNMRYNPKVLTKLVRNYRSHVAIIRQPNMLFYDNELQACADPASINAMCGWEKLPNKNFPIIFHSVVGEELREEKSPSFFNPVEIHLVMKYVKELKQLTGKFKVADKDIGVITPYHKQVMKIKNKFLSNGWNNIRVGSVEEFQGQERKVIIVSTVRSKPMYLSLDFKHNIGFLRNPQRFNVTITRAKCLVIVIGNPAILQKDEIWKSFIGYIKENSGMINDHQLLDEDNFYEDTLQRLEQMQLSS